MVGNRERMETWGKLRETEMLFFVAWIRRLRTDMRENEGQEHLYEESKIFLDTQMKTP